jgi:hypothetical protein
MIKGGRMVHDELVEAGASAMPKTLSRRARETWTVIVLDAVEPLIRADEGKRNAIAEVERAWAERADLRAKVEALRMDAVAASGHAEGDAEIYAAIGGVAMADDVLALIGGSSDGQG